MLENLKVLELASVLAGPSVGQFFAELGAEVIKVENINTGGDITRSWRSAGEETDDRSAYFCSVNWGKKSLAADLSINEGRKIVQHLARRSDVVIASYKSGDAEKLGVDYKTLSDLNPQIIYGQISGYGNNNSRLGYDAVVQAEAGFMFMNGEPGGPSLKMPVALIDILAAHHLKEGLLLAMLEKTQTGKGKLIEVSLIQAAVSSLTNQASNWLVAGRSPQKQGSAHPNIAPYGDVFMTKDAVEILLAIGSDRQFNDLCETLQLIDVSKDARFINNQRRVVNRQALNKILGSSIQEYSSQDLLAKFHAAKTPAGIIQNIKQVFEMPEVQDLLLKNPAVNFSGVRNFAGIGYDVVKTLSPPPHFGEHTQEILNQNGFQNRYK
jgi:crotonobetainyl-CoA:carnitine CoA-transferase CaiB-like acyl-CoA transferase